MSLDARFYFFEFEWFGDVITATGSECRQLIFFVVQRTFISGIVTSSKIKSGGS